MNNIRIYYRIHNTFTFIYIFSSSLPYSLLTFTAKFLNFNLLQSSFVLVIPLKMPLLQLSVTPSMPISDTVRPYLSCQICSIWYCGQFWNFLLPWLLWHHSFPVFFLLFIGCSSIFSLKSVLHSLSGGLQQDWALVDYSVIHMSVSFYWVYPLPCLIFPLLLLDQLQHNLFAFMVWETHAVLIASGGEQCFSFSSIFHIL